MSESKSGKREVNKVLYILMAFLLGGLGVHRFLRGQVGIGIIYILTFGGGFGIGPLVDFIIGLTKLGSYGDDFVFTDRGNWA